MEIYVGKYRLLGSCGSSFSKNKEWKKILKSTAAHSAVTLEEAQTHFQEKIDAKNHLLRDILKWIRDC